MTTTAKILAAALADSGFETEAGDRTEITAALTAIQDGKALTARDLYITATVIEGASDALLTTAGVTAAEADKTLGDVVTLLTAAQTA
jgi:hypothetical protein